MPGIQTERIDPHFRERRERIATAVFAELVGRAGEHRPEHTEAAVKAADALINALESKGV